MKLKIALSGLGLLFIVLLAISCRKDFGSYFDDSASADPIIENAKIFYARNATVNSFTKPQPQKLMSRSGSRIRVFIKLVPQWKKAFTIQGRNNRLLVIPTGDNVLKNKKIKISRFFVFKLKDNEPFDGKIIEVVNQNTDQNLDAVEFVKSFDQENIPNFTGGILIYDLNYFYITSHFFKDGRLENKTGEISGVAATKNGAEIQSNSTESTYGQSCSDWYLVTTYYNSNGSIAEQYWDYLYTECTDIPNGCTQDCSGSYGGGSGGNYGGNAASTSVINSTEDPCSKKAVNDALTDGVPNEIRNMFLTQFGSSANSNITFKDVNLPVTDHRDAFVGDKVYNPNGSEFSATINLNLTTFKIRSDEYNYATIYHEVIHAYLRSRFPENQEGQIILPPQHETMANDFVVKLTAALTSQFLDLSYADARALAWTGLKDTTAWALLPETEKTDLNSRVAYYMDKDNHESVKKGHYCN